MVLNKIDLLADKSEPGAKCVDNGDQRSVFQVSAKTGTGIPALIEGIGAALGVVAPHEVVLDSADGRTRAWLYRTGAVLDEQLMENGSLQLTLQADEQLLKQLKTSSQVLLRESNTLPKLSISN
jgi:50S ribosomal subunit-associated GTPase HflX